MNNQNQNTSLGQSTTGGALQASTVSQPTAGSSGFQQSGGNFAGDIAGVGSGLNQSGPSRVLSSSTVRTDEANKAPLKSGNDFPVFGLITLVVGFVFLIWLVQKKVFEEN